jgi:hypothetical protein
LPSSRFRLSTTLSFYPLIIINLINIFWQIILGCLNLSFVIKLRRWSLEILGQFSLSLKLVAVILFGTLRQKLQRSSHIVVVVINIAFHFL